MAVVGFTITKVVANATNAPKGQIKVTPKISIVDVTVRDFPMSKDGDQKVIVSQFSCGFQYEGESEITIEGSQLYLVPKAIADETEKTYAKTKKLPVSVMQNIMGGIFARCQLTSIVLAKEVGLPCPIPLPKLTVNTTDKKTK